MFRRVGREVEYLDLVLVLRQTLLDGLGVMDAQIVNDQKDFLFRVLDDTLRKSMKIATFSAPL